jgi:hypothetical protein
VRSVAPAGGGGRSLLALSIAACFMIEAIVSGLILASVSGLVFLSYKHHEGYKLLAGTLKLGAWAVFIGMICYDMGFSAGKYSDGKPMAFSSGWATLRFHGILVVSQAFRFSACTYTPKPEE